VNACYERRISGIGLDMSQSYHRPANLLGALALVVCERLGGATAGPGDRLPASEPAALVTLAHYPHQSIDVLARTLGLTHSGAVRLVDRLEAASLVRRTSAGHGRTLALRLTGKGTRAARQVLDRRQATLERVLANLDPEEVARLEGIAERLLAALTTDRQSAHHICRLCDEGICVRGAACPVDQAVAG
jgi:MarR family transcriptional regulator, negative regulator of the multidrug operon emrRAB